MIVTNKSNINKNEKVNDEDGKKNPKLIDQLFENKGIIYLSSNLS